jgi:hypothetical protein
MSWLTPALNTLFGSSKSSSQSTSTPVEMQAPEFQALRGPFSEQLSNLMENGPPQFGGPFSAPIGASEQDILGELRGQTGPGTQRQGYLNDVLGGKYLNSNPFLDAAIRAAQRPTLEGLQETLGRVLPGRFTQIGQMTQSGGGTGGGGGGSSAFDRAAAIATRGASSALGDIATNMSFGSYGQERGMQQQAVGLDQAEVDSTIKNLQAQALPRMIQEMGIERGMEAFKTNIAAVLDILKTIAGVTAPVIANKSQSTGTSEGHPGIIKFNVGIGTPK